MKNRELLLYGALGVTGLVGGYYIFKTKPPNQPIGAVLSPTGGGVNGGFGPNTPGTNTSGIQEALDTAAMVGGSILAMPGNYTYSGTVNITNKQLHVGRLDFSNCMFTYTGTTSAFLVNQSGNDTYLDLDLGSINAAGSAVSSINAVGIIFGAPNSRLRAQIQNFQGGTGLVLFSGSNSSIFQISVMETLNHIDVQGQIQGIYFQEFIGFNSNPAITGAVGLHMGVNTNANIIGANFGNFSFNDYTGNPMTLLKFDDFSEGAVYFEALSSESNTTGNMTLFNINASSPTPSSRILMPNNASFATTRAGNRVLTGNAVNIITTGAGNLYGQLEALPITLYTGNFQGGTTAIVNDGRITATAFQLTNPATGTTPQFDIWYVPGKGGGLKPVSTGDIACAIKVNQANVPVQIGLQEYDSQNIQLPTPKYAMNFIPPAANTWYYVRFPILSSYQNASTANVHVWLPNVPANTIVTLAEVAYYAQGSHV